MADASSLKLGSWWTAIGKIASKLFSSKTAIWALLGVGGQAMVSGLAGVYLMIASLLNKAAVDVGGGFDMVRGITVNLTAWCTTHSLTDSGTVDILGAIKFANTVLPIKEVLDLAIALIAWWLVLAAIKKAVEFFANARMLAALLAVG